MAEGTPDHDSKIKALETEDINTGSSTLGPEITERGGMVGGGEGPRERGHMYTYGSFMLMHGRNQHNIVKQLSSI